MEFGRGDRAGETWRREGNVTASRTLLVAYHEPGRVSMLVRTVPVAPGQRLRWNKKYLIIPGPELGGGSIQKLTTL